MKNSLYFFLLLPSFLLAQAPDLSKNWKIKLGDDMTWASPTYNDSDWKSISPMTFYENQGYEGYNGYSWYRIKFFLSSAIRKNSLLKDSVRIIVGRVDDIDATYLNGEKVGGIGRFPGDPLGEFGWYDKLRIYTIPVNDKRLLWDAENTLAVRVYDGGGGGGLWGVMPSIDMVDVVDFITLNTDAGGFDFSQKGTIKKMLKVENTNNNEVDGTLRIEVKAPDGRILQQSVAAKLTKNQGFTHTFSFENIENAKVTYTFEEKNTGKKITASQITPYILTPAEKPAPRITNALVYGVRPNTSFLWTVRATGSRPMTFGADKLPPSLSIDPTTGIITGTSPMLVGNYDIIIKATNSLGTTRQKLSIVVGDKLALTPPMGWNSWNSWAMSVSQDRVKSSADAIEKTGLINHGWSYIVIDDGWQGDLAKNNSTGVNEKFPNMKSLADDLHAKGLKFGIYSSPGKKSCGGLLTSYGHEREDAQQWADWGVDYVKYDWCSYNEILVGKTQKQWTEAEQLLPFAKMNKELNATKRDMLLSVCNWGMNDVWKWAHKSGGQLWRTSGDIEDSWASLSTIGLALPDLAPYGKIGGWNDPDMLIVGWVGWGDKLHQSHLTPAEQYTHITMWSMASAPMMIGCDVARLDAFTYNLLANHEVNAINQDILGSMPTVLFKDKDIQVWEKKLYNGKRAIAIFNLKDEKIILDNFFGLAKKKKVRNLWRQEDVPLKKLFSEGILPHGCMMFVVG